MECCPRAGLQLEQHGLQLEQLIGEGACSLTVDRGMLVGQGIAQGLGLVRVRIRKLKWFHQDEIARSAGEGGC